jgi:hypothetical protein
MKKFFLLFITSLILLGCSSEDVPPSHKGRMFDRSGFWSAYQGGHGFNGPMLEPGSYFTGIYDHVRLIECSQKTIKEEMGALTRDGVQFKLDVYTSFGANCSSENSVKTILEKLSPIQDPKSDEVNRTVSAQQIYDTFIRPALGEAVRIAVSPYNANDVNANREKIFAEFGAIFDSSIHSQSTGLVSVFSKYMSNLDFPPEMDSANVDRAVQAILREKSIEEQKRVEAEVQVSKTRIQVVEAEAASEVAKIDAIGAAWRRNPEFNLNDIYSSAGKNGNIVVLPPPGFGNLILQMKK